MQFAGNERIRAASRAASESSALNSNLIGHALASGGRIGREQGTTLASGPYQ